MNEPEKERILQMLHDGLLRPEEAARLLAALSDAGPPSTAQIAKSPPARKAKEATPDEKLVEVQIKRGDGSYSSVHVPPGLVPTLWEMAKVAIADSARTAASETWSGFKNIVRRNTRAVTQGVKTRITGGGKRSGEGAPPGPTPHHEAQLEHRRQILQMVQNGRITADAAGRLIQELDAVNAYEAARSTAIATQPPVPARSR